MRASNVILTNRQPYLLKKPVQSGHYKGTSEVLRNTFCLRPLRELEAKAYPQGLLPGKSAAFVVGYFRWKDTFAGKILSLEKDVYALAIKSSGPMGLMSKEPTVVNFCFVQWSF